MPVTDPIADMLTRIRNAVMMRHDSLEIPASKAKVSIITILKSEGFIRDFALAKGSTPQSVIKVRLYYHEGNEPAISGLKRVSKPGLRIYVGKDEIPRHYGGLATSILSTSKGILSGGQAKRQGVGGELLCYVW